MERFDDEAGGLGLVLVGGVVWVISSLIGWHLLSDVSLALILIGVYFAFQRHRKNKLPF